LEVSTVNTGKFEFDIGEPTLLSSIKQKRCDLYHTWSAAFFDGKIKICFKLH
jgi:hypothetical protein